MELEQIHMEMELIFVYFNNYPLVLLGTAITFARLQHDGNVDSEIHLLITSKLQNNRKDDFKKS